MAGSAPLRFTSLSPAPDVGFWQELTRQKLDIQRLDSSPLQVQAYFVAPPKADVAEKCFLLREAFDLSCKFEAGSTRLRGELQNFNIMEEFKDFLSSGARAERVSELARHLRNDIVSGAALTDPELLRRFLVISFADLKKYVFTYTTAFPYLAPKDAPFQSYAEPCGAEQAGFSRELLSNLSEMLRNDAQLSSAGAFLLVQSSGSSASWDTKPRPLSFLQELAKQGAAENAEWALVFVDSASQPEVVGWPLRNLLLAVAYHRPGRCKVLAFRDPHLQASKDATVRSRVFFVEARSAQAESVLTDPPPAAAQFAGWSKIQSVDLKVFMDVKRIASDAIDLNVKLIKWRILPDMEPEKMKNLRFLLLGSGTLGCSIARTLMGWGVRKLSFVDSGKVSFSNPVRQSLFTHQDAAEGKSKAKCAREAVEAVMPDAEAEHYELEVPMPGHPHQSAEVLQKTICKLRDLIESHDVICMLTDSRESRWLPSLLIAAAQRSALDFQPPLRDSSSAEAAAQEAPTKKCPPLGLTVALGFDSFLVQRQTYLDAPAACYFCNDLTAPKDSLAFRTLDQQCTVTRPGLSSMAAGVAGELVASLVQHREGFKANCTTCSDANGSMLGAVPHQIRCFLADFKLCPMETEPSKMCICCSPNILDTYRREGDAFIMRVIANSAELEEISGLAAMKAAHHADDCLAFDEFDDFDDGAPDEDAAPQ